MYHGLYHLVRVEDKIPEITEAVDCCDCVQHQHTCVYLHIEDEGPIGSWN